MTQPASSPALPTAPAPIPEGSTPPMAPGETVPPSPDPTSPAPTSPGGSAPITSPSDSYVKLAMRNMVRKRGMSLVHFSLTTIGLLAVLVGLAYLTR